MKSRRLYYISRIAEVFQEYGFSNLKVEEIAFLLGITKKTLYNYFDSKKEMLESVVDYISKTRMTKLRNKFVCFSNPIDSLVYIGQHLFSVSQEYCSRMQPQLPQIGSSAVIQNIFKERRDELLEIVTFNFNKGVYLGIFDSDLDVNLASSYYIFHLENLFITQNTLRSLIVNNKQVSQLLYYQLKGSCSSKGLEQLRNSFDLRVTAC